MKKYSITLLSLLGLFSFIGLFAAVPNGYYNAADGKSGAQLKTALSNIVKGGTRLSYGSGSNSTWSGFEKTDRRDDGSVWDMYSNIPRQFPGNGAVPSGMNIEHSVANSWWGGTNNDAYKDLYLLNPSDISANSAKSNYPPGVITGSTSFNNGVITVGNNSYGSTYTGKCFEVIDEYKGDFARAYFYIFTAYEALNWNNTVAPNFVNYTETYPLLKPWASAMLLEWARLDPVSTKEINRNEEVYKIQSNRNPFIDFPQLMEYLWGDKAGQVFYFTNSTDPMITSPSAGSTITLSDTYFLESTTQSISLKGANLTAPIQLALSGAGSSHFQLSATSFTAAQVNNGVTVDVIYTPSEVATHSSVLTISGGGLSKAVTITLSGTGVDNFVMLTPTDITSDGFTAHWSAVSGATNYAISLYKVEQTGQSPVLMLQNHCTSTPAGWTVGGYTDYTTATSFIRLASGSSYGSITTPAIDLSSGATLQVTAKVYGNDTGVDLAVVVDGTPVQTLTLTATNKKYEVQIPAFTSTSKVTLSALANRRAMVDLIELYTTEVATKATLMNGYPISVGNSLNYSISGLENIDSRTFNVEVDASGAGVEKKTETQTVHIPDPSGVRPEESKSVKVGVDGSRIVVVGSSVGSRIEVIGVDGGMIAERRSQGGEESITLSSRGVFLVRVTAEGITNVAKVVLRR